MKKSILQKFTGLIFLSILLVLNITKVVNFSAKLKFNMALSDFFIPLFIGLSVFLWKQYGFKKVYKGFWSWISLILWIILVAFIAMKNDLIVDGGWFGLFEELIKTALCVLYFIVGYNSLRAINIKTIQYTWSLATLIFVVGGFAIYILATNDLYYWSNDPKYLRMFMGTDTDPNHAATFLTLSFFGMAIFAMLSEKMNSKIYFYLMMSVSVAGLIFTGSRGGLFGFILGITLLLVFYAYKNWRVSLALILILVLMTTVFLSIDQLYLDSVFSQRLVYKFVNIESDINIRASLSRVAWMMGVDHPLFGVGRGNYILNSPKYFEQLGVNYIENIPHNTYFGLVAETGVIGLLLFCTPFLMVVHSLKNRYKNNREYLKQEGPILFWIIAGVCALSVQAFVLNVENRRFLWYIAGLLVFVFENNTVLAAPLSKQLKIKHMTLGLGILSLLVILSTIITIRIVRVPILTHNIAQNYNYEIPYKKFIVGETYNIGVQLVVDQNVEQTDRVQLKIVEVSNEGIKRVLDSYSYKGAKGVVIRSFTPSMKDSRIYLKVHKLDQSLSKFNILPVYLHDKNNVVDLTKWYFLQPKHMQKKTLKENSESYNDWKTKTDLSKGLKSTFDKKLRLESIYVNQLDNLSTKVTVRIYSYLDLTENYIPFLYGYPENLHMKDGLMIASGIEGYKLIEPEHISIWKAEETYQFDFNIPRQNGIYALKLGFYYFKDDEMAYLPVDNVLAPDQSLLDLGWLNLDTFTEGIIYE